MGSSKVANGWAEVWAVWERKAGVRTKAVLLGTLPFGLWGSDPNSRQVAVITEFHLRTLCWYQKIGVRIHHYKYSQVKKPQKGPFRIGHVVSETVTTLHFHSSGKLGGTFTWAQSQSSQILGTGSTRRRSPHSHLSQDGSLNISEAWLLCNCPLMRHLVASPTNLSNSHPTLYLAFSQNSYHPLA